MVCDRYHAGFDELLQQVFRHLVVGVGDRSPGFLVDQAVAQRASDQKIFRTVILLRPACSISRRA
jgi:hypothetical protein